jgi:hypothetical protein
VSEHQRGEKCSREEDQKKTYRPESDKVAGGKGWHSRERKPKELEGEEGHIALGVEGH